MWRSILTLAILVMSATYGWAQQQLPRKPDIKVNPITRQATTPYGTTITRATAEVKDARLTPQQRLLAAYELGRAGPGVGREAVQVLQKAVNDPDPAVRFVAAWALMQINPAAARQAGVTGAVPDTIRQPPPRR